ncbi:hypothetical protein VQ042_21850 [Aurantimonas sp. A2-1-M11]|uniref:hypothetical protein n=1 Tax=Aurantimonas sp. A2-1-M11 TaxID=3113712 RepID=UPI002F94CA24
MKVIVMASLTPISDPELLDGEYVALRPATDEERRTLGFRRRAIVYTVVLRSCAGITGSARVWILPGKPFRQRSPLV